jgi:outer membrane protein insertion porin family
LFADAGNIWLWDKDRSREGSDLQNFNKFVSDIAIGAGMGLRLDFDYFLVRFDFGMQLKDPAKITGERWIWEGKDEYEEYLDEYFPSNSGNGRSPVINFNLGIGYPF